MKVLVLLIILIFSTLSGAQEFESQVARVNNVSLQYIEQGKGTPVIFVHGSLDDLRYWDAQIAPFAHEYLVIAYSRRYNYPNKNELPSISNHSALVEAEDLAAFIRHKNLAPAHLIGASYGAYTALLVALKHPDLVRSLVLTEPPVLNLAELTEKGKTAVQDFRTKVWTACARAFQNNQDEEALKVAVDYFAGPGVFEEIPAESKDYWRANLAEWRALVTSTDAFPAISAGELQALKKPVLMLSGADTNPIHKLIDSQLETLLPDNQRIIVENAGHEVWQESAHKCRSATLLFLHKH